MGLEFFFRGPDEELVHEQVMPREFIDYLDWQLVSRVSAAEKVLNIHLLAGEIFEDTVVERIELFGGKRQVHGTPRDLVLGDGVLYRELVFGRTARARAGLRNNCAAGAEHGFAVADGGFHQFRCREVALHVLLCQQVG